MSKFAFSTISSSPWRIKIILLVCVYHSSVSSYIFKLNGRSWETVGTCACRQILYQDNNQTWSSNLFILSDQNSLQNWYELIDEISTQLKIYWQKGWVFTSSWNYNTQASSRLAEAHAQLSLMILIRFWEVTAWWLQDEPSRVSWHLGPFTTWMWMKGNNRV